MPGPEPKHSSVRARRNATSTKATLRLVHDVEAPELPDRQDGWHELTTQWWADIWASPMAPEYDDSDRHGLFALAQLVDDFWRTDSAAARSKIAGEIRLQRQCFGLTPMDRRRLQWEIERGEEASEKTEKRRAAVKPPAEQPADPRGILRAL